MVMMLSSTSGFSRRDLNETNKKLFAFSSRNEGHNLSEVCGENKACAQGQGTFFVETPCFLNEITE